jgi:uncharacterized membrane protein YeiH
MTTPLLLTVGLIPSMFLLLVVLTTFLNSTRAYAGISLVPLALGLTVFALVSLSAVEHSPDYWWPDLYEKIVWASAVQTGLGIGLIIRVLYRRRPVVLLVVATLLTASHDATEQARSRQFRIATVTILLWY